MRERETHAACRLGHRHWGAHGAAGLLMRSGDMVYLQRRSASVDSPGTYSVPGGALQAAEEVFVGALRESTEELGPLPYLDVEALLIDDHGGWAYHTVVARCRPFEPRGGTHAWESDGGGWFFEHELNSLPLHPGFAASIGALL